MHWGIPLKITRLCTVPDNHSFFLKIAKCCSNQGSAGNFFRATGAKAVFIREIPPGYVYPWHTVVCREYVVTIERQVKIEAGTGKNAEDVAGKGDPARAIGTKPRRQIFVTLP